MKELQTLLEYIDSYIYVDDEEEIVVKHGPFAAKAQQVYEEALDTLDIKENESAPSSEDDFDFIFSYSPSNRKWEFDIALDCVRRMDESDREYVRNHMQTTEYHFGYAMGIRNQYIHHAKKHSVFEADSVSSSIMTIIFSIVSPLYDFRNRVIAGFFDNMSLSNLLERYGETQKTVFDKIYENLANDRYTTSEEAREDLDNSLRESLGPDEFIKIFKEALKDYNENESENDREDWYWNTNFPACKAMLYPLQARQASILRKMGLCSQIERLSIKNFNECRTYIDTEVGLREDYADYMARCFWETCSPVLNNKWQGISLYPLDIEYSVRWKLDDAGIDTLGKICELTYKDLSHINGIAPQDAGLIEAALSAIGLSLSE